jgi:hypothetical protein
MTHAIIHNYLWFSPGIPVISTDKTDRHDIIEKLLRVAFKHNNLNFSSFMTYHRICNVTRLTRRVSLVEQELITLPEHMSSPPPPVFSGVRVTRSLVLCVCFVDRCLFFCTFFWPLCCLFFFDIRILIAPLVSSNLS